LTHATQGTRRTDDVTINGEPAYGMYASISSFGGVIDTFRMEIVHGSVFLELGYRWFPKQCRWAFPGIEVNRVVLKSIS